VVADARLNMSLLEALAAFSTAQRMLVRVVSDYSLTVHSCLRWIRDLMKIDQHLSVYFTAVTFLHAACKTVRAAPLKDELLDVLATTCLQSNDARRCVNARHSNVLSISQAAN